MTKKFASRQEFLMVRNAYLTSTRPVQSVEHLKGREKMLRALTDALTVPGRHAFVYGYRGVGKSSLAQTAAFQLQSSVGKPILLGGEPAASFSTLCGEAIKRAFNVSPIETKAQKKISANASYAGVGVGGGYENSKAQGDIKVNSVNDAVAYFQAACERAPQGFVIVVDEFDQITSLEEHQKFALLLKQISDQHLPVRFILSGVAESIDKLFSQHASIFRQTHAQIVERLDLQACLDIIEDAAQALCIEMRGDFKYRIAQISDGFPAFVHLISEKVFTAAYDREHAKVEQASYEEGIAEAIGSVELSLKNNYETTLHRNTHKYEHVIWSVANDKLLDVNIEMVWQHYNTICDQLALKPVTRQNITTKLSQLTDEKYGEILQKVRRSNYTFTEKMMRAYARLRAERNGCLLGPENAALVGKKRA